MAYETYDDISVDYDDSEVGYDGAQMWWIAAVSSAWSVIGNWSATEGGASNGAIPTGADDVYFSDTSKLGGTSGISASSNCLNMYTGSAQTGGTDDWSGSINVGGYDLNIAGNITLASGSVLVVGATSSTGVTIHGNLTNTVVDGFDLQTTSKFILHGNVTWGANPFKTSDTGDFTQASSGTMAGGSGRDVPYNWRINTGVTSTATGFTFSSNSFYSDGAIVATSGFNSIGVSASGSFIFDTNATYSGTNTISLKIRDGATITFNPASAMAFSGAIQLVQFDTGVRLIPIGKWNNAELQVRQTSSAATRNWKGYAGTLEISDFKFEFDAANATIACTFSGIAQTIKISESINFISGSDTGTATLNYTKGSEVFECVTGSVGTHGLNFWDKSINALTINSSDDTDIKKLTDGVTITTLTCTDGKFDVDTQDITVVNAVTIPSGFIFKMGVTASTGVTLSNNLTLQATCIMDLQTASKISCAGNYSCANVSIWANNNRGNYTQADDGTYTTLNINNIWSQLTINATKTLTIGTTNTYLGSFVSCTINGALAVGALNCRLFGANGTLTFGVNSDITGSGILESWNSSVTTYINNKTGAFSFTGIVSIAGSAYNNAIGLTGDFSNADYRFVGTSAIREMTFASGTLKCKAFTITNNNNFNITITNTTNNPSFNWSGEADFNAGAGSYTTVWTRGTGDITLTGSAADIDFNGQTIEKLVINCTAGQTKTNIDDFTTRHIDLILGTFDIVNTTVTNDNAGGDGVTAITAGVLKIGATGVLTTVGFDASGASANTIDLQTGTIINNSANYSCANASIFTTNTTGKYNQTGNGTFLSNHSDNDFYEFIVKNGVKISYSSSSRFSGSNKFELEAGASIECTAFGSASIRTSATGSCIIAATSDFTTTSGGSLNFSIVRGATVTNNRTTAFGWTSTVNMIAATGVGNTSVPGDWTNASSIKIVGYSANARIFPQGTMKCSVFNIDFSSATGTEVDNSVYNPSYEINDNVNYAAGVSGYVYIKGTGSITCKASSGTVTWTIDGKSIEAVIFNTTGAIIEFADNWSTVSLNSTGGTLRSTSAGSQRAITAAGTGVALDTTFKDISMGSANKVNAKSISNPCTNLGNTLGIIFVDAMGYL